MTNDSSRPWRQRTRDDVPDFSRAPISNPFVTVSREAETLRARNQMKEILAHLVANPKAWAYVELGPESVCACGHTKLDHRIDSTCGKCLCIKWLVDK